MLIETGPLFKLYYRNLAHVVSVPIDATNSRFAKDSNKMHLELHRTTKKSPPKENTKKHMARVCHTSAIWKSAVLLQEAHVQCFSKNHSQVLRALKIFLLMFQ